MLKYILNIALILVCLVMGTSIGLGAGDSFEPWEFELGEAKQKTVTRSDARQENISLPSQAVMGALNFFSEYISKVDGDRCPMHPTCASYSRQAVKKHGVFMGIVMTADRLIHEGSEMDYAPLVKAGGGVRYYDPVNWNDYWWYNRESLDK
ncbi:MAG: membrane protein insertion efficiency factor YidD [Deltaproteobacteria bacterium]|nr:membrane protein insertion efficiency factor YidD [Deltaproteobacteria bacterium]